MKKPGLLKRIFSFGRKKKEDVIEDEDIDTRAEIPVDAPPAHPPEEPVEETVANEIADDARDYTDHVPLEPATEHPIESAETPASMAVKEAVEPVPALSESETPPPQPEPDDPALAAGIHIVSKGAATDETATASPVEKKSWIKRLSKGLSRSSSQLGENIAAVFTKKKLDGDALEALEDILLQADLGAETAMNVVDALAAQRMGKDISDQEVRATMAEEIEKVLVPVVKPLELDLDHKPHVILVVGVNGSGKTTTIGKLAQKLRHGGFSTMLVAGDTFRAAAIEQLVIWGERTGSPVISRKLGSDSSGLAFDAWREAKDQGHDVLMIDTAGRLQNKTELMAELEKIIRVIKKHDPAAPHTVLLTLDATTGQNALNQVEVFSKVAGVNGLIMTKLDGSARGGILVAISAKYGLPVYFAGVGEQVEDLEPFEARDFARSIAGLEI